MFEELTTLSTYKGIIPEIEKENEDEPDELERVMQASDILCKKLLTPKINNLDERQKSAILWYEILTSQPRKGTDR